MKNAPGTSSAENAYFDELKGFVCYIPSVIVGEPMTIRYSNAITLRYKTAPVTHYAIDCSTGVYSVETTEEAYQLLDLELDRKNWKKRIVSTLYMESHIFHNPLRTEKDPDGHLFADGRFKTKIYASDLPEHFVYGYLYKRHGFISALGVKHMLYVPNYIFNHRHKYDSLYISYDAPIQAVADDHGRVLYDGWKHIVDGPLILDFVNAAEKFSRYDVTQIRREIKKKSDWYDENYRKDG